MKRRYDASLSCIVISCTSRATIRELHRNIFWAYCCVRTLGLRGKKQNCTTVTLIKLHDVVESQLYNHFYSFCDVGRCRFWVFAYQNGRRQLFKYEMADGCLELIWQMPNQCSIHRDKGSIKLIIRSHVLSSCKICSRFVVIFTHSHMR